MKITKKNILTVLVMFVICVSGLAVSGCATSVQTGKTQFKLIGTDENGKLVFCYIQTDGTSLQVSDKKTMQMMHDDLNKRIAHKDKTDVIYYAMGRNNKCERIVTTPEQLLQLTSSMGW